MAIKNKYSCHPGGQKNVAQMRKGSSCKSPLSDHLKNAKDQVFGLILKSTSYCKPRYLIKPF